MLKQRDMIGTKIKRIREMRGITQEEIAEELNLTAQAYGRMERGETSISAERLGKIAEKLGVNTDEIMRYDENKYVISGNSNNGEANENGVQFNLNIYESDIAVEALKETIKNQQEQIKFLQIQVEKLTDLLLKK
jgi:transcriptional regulator with XRE-family HTH domain